MKKTAGYVSGLLKTILFIGFSIQIVLGIVWMCLNITCLQTFSVSGGPLYTVLARIGDSAYPVLYLLQLAAAAGADFYFMKQWCGDRKFLNIWGMLCLLTFPFVLQCHLAVAPFSLTCSLFLLELTFTIRYIRRTEVILSDVVCACVCWALLTLLRPEYILLGAVPVLLMLLLRLIAREKNKMGLCRSALIIAAFWGMTWGVLSLSGQERVYSRENIAFCMFSRSVWPTLWQDALVLWQNNELPGITTEILQQAAGQAEDLRRVVKPLVEEALTVDEAVKFYYVKASAGWVLRREALLKQCAKDFAYYVLSPAFLPMQLEGKGGDTYSGRNYEVMLYSYPELTGNYVYYGCWWFMTALVLTVILAAATRLAGGKETEREHLKPWMLCALSVMLLALAYTMRGAGMMDYKCTCVVILLWQSWSLALMGKEV
ncbi:MAG: hypothetical protein ACI4HQ_13665 [Acetatifactor sp.]